MVRRRRARNERSAAYGSVENQDTLCNRVCAVYARCARTYFCEVIQSLCYPRKEVGEQMDRTLLFSGGFISCYGDLVPAETGWEKPVQQPCLHGPPYTNVHQSAC